MNFNGLSDTSFLIKDALNYKKDNDISSDLNGMDKLSKNEKIKRISVQFEQMLVQTLLKDALKEDNNESGFGMGKNTLTDFRLNLFSQYITESGGLGYQKIIEQQIREKYFNSSQEADDNKSEDIVKNTDFIREFHSNSSIFDNSDYKLKELNNLWGKLKDKISFSNSKKTLPVKGRISSKFGWREDPFDNKIRFHSGIDIAVKKNTPVKSFMDGEVIFSGWKKGYGNIIEIKHRDGYITKYGHNEKLLVKKGDRVKSGDIICMSGSTGRSTGPHLHFEIVHNDKAIDPKKFLP